MSLQSFLLYFPLFMAYGSIVSTKVGLKFVDLVITYLYYLF